MDFVSLRVNSFSAYYPKLIKRNIRIKCNATSENSAKDQSNSLNVIKIQANMKVTRYSYQSIKST